MQGFPKAWSQITTFFILDWTPKIKSVCCITPASRCVTQSQWLSLRKGGTLTLKKKTSSVLSEQEQSFIFLCKSKLLCLARHYTLSDIYVFWCGTSLLKTVQCSAEQDCAQNFSTLWELGLERLHAVPEQLLLFSFYIHILLCQTRPDSLLILYEVLHKIYSTPVLCS